MADCNQIVRAVTTAPGSWPPGDHAPRQAHSGAAKDNRSPHGLLWPHSAPAFVGIQMPVGDLFEAKLAAAWPPAVWRDTSVLLAVSGGADSVALARAAAAIRQAGEGQLIIAHFNHRLRGAASDADEHFVGELARQLGLPFQSGRADPVSLTSSGGDGLEAAARARDTRFFERPPSAWEPAMSSRPTRPTIRPKRSCTGSCAGRAWPAWPARNEFARWARPCRWCGPCWTSAGRKCSQYLAALGKSFCDDESNRDRRFTRNRLRHELLPQLAEQYNPQVREALLRLGSLAAEAQQVIDRLVDDLLASAWEESTAEFVELGLDLLASQPPYLVRELLIAVWKRQGWPLQAMGYVEWEQLADIVRGAGETKRVFPGGIAAERDGASLRLIRV